MRRKEKFYTGNFFHIFNKSIANYTIFKDLDNCIRFFQNLGYYNQQTILERISTFLEKNKDYRPDVLLPDDRHQVKIISYCIMPDHYHLLVKILKESCISQYISNVENSYSHFFNIKFKRKGPLWQSRFKAVRIKNNEQLLHVSRYIHLNPTTANLANKPEEWIFSSYREIINNPKILKEKITEISISNNLLYKRFVENNIDYQRKLKLIKKLVLE
ncbi:hypothetical protein COY13_03345 [Candidatus Roizmanbacteria bacterium CG_4_10_14_0_2_um_filter_36_35]|uniref:Transposase IS200-like domain-containing protein n=3 Tax=Candidatus Roizmaniibacteriota TaxID=1752723 RepID=A0A2M7BXX9_9BACT|nr:MAG: hypothetical protein COV86_04890 [Candidatus Roizmanbacteria bacterium CG11_big_fil_rev_8_21_14_0_20_35_14]PIV11431.1 MAG: hypothetical protein COS50_00205 [Candidatus Roizmanbacteria bacterium CG03_land_8_20_14_0_80_35_26]PIZ67352.1 MAG: hypothetical protein COY13_03345 [Candidatus Roizmanbacteria bacterium CG_4_10_14_0_2_um_filter_36_35]PJC80762.1 MAG: hypothetical protein CO008_01010 [Candidatus Roizmanbacteria bacterium CG_4_8_14_3_um_filter_36_12]